MRRPWHLPMLSAVAHLALPGCLAAVVPPDPGVQIGSEAPEFALPDRNADSPTHDETRSLSEVRGKVLILYFLDYT